MTTTREDSFSLAGPAYLPEKFKESKSAHLESLREMKALISKSFPYIVKAKGQDLVLILGDTGAGKSSITSYQLGTNFKWDEEDYIYKPIYPPGSDPADFPSVRGGGVSETLFPIPYQKPGDRFFYCDCPGFNDTREDIIRSFTSVSTQMIINLANRINAIVITINFSTINNLRGDAFVERCTIPGKLLDQLLTDPVSAAKSILFLFTHIDEKFLKNLKKTKQLIVDMVRTKLQEEKKKMASNSSPKDKTESNEDLQARLNILTLLDNNPENIVLANIFDQNKEGRQPIIDFVKKASPVNKDKFNFKNYDHKRTTFDLTFYEVVKDGLILLKRREQLIEEVADYKQQIKEVDNLIKSNNNLLNVFKSDQTLGVDQAKKLSRHSLTLLSADLDFHSRAISDFKKDIEEKESNENVLKSRLSAIDRDEADNEPYWGDQLEKKNFFYEFFSESTKYFQYRGVKFKKVEEIIDGKIINRPEFYLKDRTVDYQRGRYSAIAIGRRVNVSIRVNIYLSICDKPDNQAQIRILKEDLENIGGHINALRKRYIEHKSRFDAITDLMKLIEKGDLESSRKIIEEKIKNQEVKKDEFVNKKIFLEESLKNSQINLDKVEKYLSDSREWFEIIDKIDEALEYRSSLIRDFRLKFSQYKNISSKDILSSRNTFRGPDNFKCKLNNMLMQEPVSAECGDTFEKVEFENYRLKEKEDATGCITCPYCKDRIRKDIMIPNKALKLEIEKWVERESKSKNFSKINEEKTLFPLEIFNYRQCPVSIPEITILSDFSQKIPFSLKQKIEIFQNNILDTEKKLDRYVIEYFENIKQGLILQKIRTIIESSNLERIKDNLLEAKKIVDIYGSLDEEENNCLIYAAKVGASFEVIKYLIEVLHFDLNYTNKKMQSVLNKVVEHRQKERIEIVQYLLQNGISLDQFYNGFSLFVHLIQIITQLRKSEEQSKEQPEINIVLDMLILVVNFYIIRQRKDHLVCNINSSLPVTPEVSLPLIHLVAEYGDSELVKDIINYYAPDVRLRFPLESKEGLVPLQRAAHPSYFRETVKIERAKMVNVFLNNLQRGSDQKIIIETQQYFEQNRSSEIKTGSDPVASSLENGLANLKILDESRKRLSKIVSLKFFDSEDEAIEKTIQTCLEDMPIESFNSIYSGKLKLNFDIEHKSSEISPLDSFNNFIRHRFLVTYLKAYKIKDSESKFKNEDMKPTGISKKKLNAIVKAIKDQSRDQKSLSKIVQFKNLIFECLSEFNENCDEYILIDIIKNKIICHVFEKYFEVKKGFTYKFQDLLDTILQEKLNSLLEIDSLTLKNNSLSLMERLQKNITESIASCLPSFSKISIAELRKIISSQVNAAYDDWLFEYGGKFVSEIEKDAYELADQVVKKLVVSTQEQEEKIRKDNIKSNPVIKQGLIIEQISVAHYIIKTSFSFYFREIKKELGNIGKKDLIERVFKVLESHNTIQLLQSAAAQSEYFNAVIKAITFTQPTLPKQNSFQENNQERKASVTTLPLELKSDIDSIDFQIKAKAFKIAFIAAVTRYLDICDALINKEVSQNPTWAAQCNNAITRISDQSSWLSSLSKVLTDRVGWMTEVQSYMPIAVGVIKALLGSIDNYILYKNAEEARNVWESFNPDKIETAEDLDKIVDALIRRFKSQFAKLSVSTSNRKGKIEPCFDTKSGIIQVATIAAVRFIAHIKNKKSKYYSDDESGLWNGLKKTGRAIGNWWDSRYDEKTEMPLDERCLRAIVAETNIGRNITLSTNDNKLNWKIAGIFDKCGYIVTEGEFAGYYRSTNSEPEIYGFCYIDGSEVSRKKLKQLSEKDLKLYLPDQNSSAEKSQMPLAEVSQGTSTNVSQKQTGGSSTESKTSATLHSIGRFYQPVSVHENKGDSKSSLENRNKSGFS